MVYELQLELLLLELLLLELPLLPLSHLTPTGGVR